MNLFDDSLLDHVDEQRAHNAVLMETTAAMENLDTTSIEGLGGSVRRWHPAACSA